MSRSVSTDSALGSGVGTLDRAGRGGVVPVGSTWNNDALSRAGAGESEVRGRQGSVRVVEVRVVADNRRVVSGTEAATVHYIVREVADGSNVLLVDDSLSFYFADLFSDDLLGDFLQNEEFLLDDRDAHGLAYNLRLFLNDLSGYLPREIVYTIEVVESRQRAKTIVVIEGHVSTVEALSLRVERSCEGAAGQGRDREQWKGDLSEHDVLLE